MSDARTADADVAADRRARLLAQTLFDRPLVLEAGAGTGKTATLVGRVLAWCLGPGWRRAADEARARRARSGKPEPVSADRVAARVLDGVVAITFTEAAAAEMANRVAQAFADVQKGALPTGTLPEALAGAGGEERERAAALLVALDHLQITTIHAFCRRLLATAPLEAGLHPSFTVDPERLVLAEVVQEVVEVGFRRALAAPESALFGLAARGIDPAQVAEALITLTSRGVPPGALDADPLAGGAVEALTAEARALASEVRDAAQAPLAGAAKAKKGSETAAGAGMLADTLSRGGSPASVAELCDRVADALPDGVVDRLNDWAKGKFTATERDLLGNAAAVLGGPAGRLAALAKHLAGLDPELLDVARRALAPLLAEVHRAMRARGAETFAALLRDAHGLLAGDAGVRARLKAEITQLMVDEFQDTDRRQCEILRLLALDGPPGERPGLFLIGDPKQSIYGWREADLAAYDGFLALVRAAGGEVISLCVNFRSRPEILAEVERVVRPVMRRETGMQPAFQPLYACDERSAETGPPAPGRAPVEYWVSWAAADGALSAPSAQGAADLEAAALAADIRELGDGGVPWGRIGVLLRSTGSLDTYLQALRDAGVPYAVERDRSYYRRREIIDAAALVRTVLDPGDHLALVATLRSSAVGIPDAALIPLWTRSFPDRVSALAAPDEAALDALRRLIGEAAAALPDDVPGIERVRGWERTLGDFLAHLARLRASFEEEPAATFVERLRTLTLFEAGEAARSLGRYRIANLERFFRTLLEAMEADADPHAVLRVLRGAVAEARDAEEGRPLSATDDAVRVTTIHKAKGLDFRHVYLVQTHRASRADAGAVVDTEEVDGGLEYALFGAPTPGWHAVESRRRRVGQAEMIRTLYVAMTRARDRLVVAGAWPEGDDEPGADIRSHMDLVSRRDTPDGGLAAAAARAAASGRSFEDAAGVRWEFPALRPAVAHSGGEAAPVALAGAGEIARQAARLDELRSDAGSRSARPFSAPASEEAHRLLRELLAGGEGEGGAGRRAEWTERSVASAAGSAVHAVLERLDLAGDLDRELARGAERLPHALAGLVGAGDAPAALARARELLERLRGGALMERLRAIAPHILARELPVLLPPGPAPDAPVGFVSGAIDLVYRDPRTGALVIADYKTDDVSSDAEVSARARAYAPQGAAYAAALRDALDLPAPPRFELWFVRCGRIVEPGTP